MGLRRNLDDETQDARARHETKMPILRELNGMKSIQSFIIVLIHIVYHHPYLLPIEPFMSYEDDRLPFAASVALQFFTVFIKAMVEPFYIMSGVVISLKAFSLLKRVYQNGGDVSITSLSFWNEIGPSWVNGILRRMLRYTLVSAPIIFVFSMYSSRTEGVLDVVFFVNNIGQSVETCFGLHLWSNAITVQAAVALPLTIFVCESLFRNMFPDEKRRRLISFMCVWFLATVLRVCLIFHHYPYMKWEHHYLHSGPFSYTGYLDTARDIAHVSKLPWEGTPEYTIAQVQFPMYDYQYLHMRISALYIGGIIAAAVHYRVRLGERTTDFLCVVALFATTLLDEFAQHHADRRWALAFDQAPHQILVATLLFAALTQQGYLGRRLSKILRSQPLQSFAPYTLCLYACHYYFVVLLTPYLTVGLSRPSPGIMVLSFAIVCVVSVPTAYLMHHLLEAPLYRYFVRVLGLDDRVVCKSPEDSLAFTNRVGSNARAWPVDDNRKLRTKSSTKLAARPYASTSGKIVG